MQIEAKLLTVAKVTFLFLPVMPQYRSVESRPDSMPETQGLAYDSTSLFAFLPMLQSSWAHIGPEVQSAPA